MRTLTQYVFFFFCKNFEFIKICEIMVCNCVLLCVHFSTSCALSFEWSAVKSFCIHLKNVFVWCCLVFDFSLRHLMRFPSICSSILPDFTPIRSQYKWYFLSKVLKFNLFGFHWKQKIKQRPNYQSHEFTYVILPYMLSLSLCSFHHCNRQG